MGLFKKNYKRLEEPKVELPIAVPQPQNTQSSSQFISNPIYQQQLGERQGFNPTINQPAYYPPEHFMSVQDISQLQNQIPNQINQPLSQSQQPLQKQQGDDDYIKRIIYNYLDKLNQDVQQIRSKLKVVETEIQVVSRVINQYNQ